MATTQITPWIGIDLDGTLAHYESWGDGSIGLPIAKMVAHVQRWLAEGKEVRIFTARVAPIGQSQVMADAERKKIDLWCVQHLGRTLDVTCQKDFGMIRLYDDRCVTVMTNTGIFMGHGEDRA